MSYLGPSVHSEPYNETRADLGARVKHWLRMYNESTNPNMPYTNQYPPPPVPDRLGYNPEDTPHGHQLPDNASWQATDQALYRQSSVPNLQENRPHVHHPMPTSTRGLAQYTGFHNTRHDIPMGTGAPHVHVVHSEDEVVRGPAQLQHQHPPRVDPKSHPSTVTAHNHYSHPSTIGSSPISSGYANTYSIPQPSNLGHVQYDARQQNHPPTVHDSEMAHGLPASAGQRNSRIHHIIPEGLQDQTPGSPVANISTSYLSQSGSPSPSPSIARRSNSNHSGLGPARTSRGQFSAQSRGSLPGDSSKVLLQALLAEQDNGQRREKAGQLREEALRADMQTWQRREEALRVEVETLRAEIQALRVKVETARAAEVNSKLEFAQLKSSSTAAGQQGEVGHFEQPSEGT